MSRHKPEHQRLSEQLFDAALALARLGEDFDRLHGLQGAEGEALLLVLDASRDGGPDDGGGAAPMTPGRLGSALRLPSASVTALVDRLERAGHVRRVRDTGDRRRVLLVPSPAARRARDAYWGGLNERIVAAMDEFGDDELAAVERFLRRVAGLASDHRAEGAD
ncbi:MarR family winged helix-turn-helix transcriptional regulator [Allonocardiopsis opalescens]|uniref:MarR family protein n=1 Tax=Allonocardiopsis opalescens TaxID=1144618 RepID=A0A2T0Q6Z1_9ACTN|nr:MarR family transcriptional regulator [Allonocardiopsis opalescens]PRX99551.1 MarR family protein [Allonocardiopsis opalescens]